MEKSTHICYTAEMPHQLFLAFDQLISGVSPFLGNLSEKAAENSRKLIAEGRMSNHIEVRDVDYDTLARVQYGTPSEIKIRIDFLAFLWCSCYFTANIYQKLVINYRELFHEDGTFKDDAEAKVTSIYQDAYRILLKGLSILREQDVSWQSDLPQPWANFQLNTQVADSCFIPALNFIIEHEVGHEKRNHRAVPKGPSKEYQADNEALEHLIAAYTENGERFKETILLGVLTAIACLSIVKDFRRETEATHPFTEGRLKNAIEKFSAANAYNEFCLTGPLFLFDAANNIYGANLEFSANWQNHEEAFSSLTQQITASRKK